MSADAYAQALALIRAGRADDALSLLAALPTALRNTQAAGRVQAIALMQSARPKEALTVVERLVNQADCEHASVLLAAKMASDVRRFDLATTHYLTAISAQPDAPRLWILLFDAAAAAHRLGEALAQIAEFSTAIDPAETIELALRVDSAFKRTRRIAEGLQFAKRILAKHPNHATARRLFIRRHVEFAPIESSPLMFFKFAPGHDELSPELLDAALALPEIFADDSRVLEWRARLLSEILNLTIGVDQYNASRTDKAPVALTLLSRMPFFVAYHGQDDLAIQRAWGALVEAIVQPHAVRFTPAPAVVKLPRKRIGIVSAHLRECTVGNYFAAWFDALTSGEFEVNLYSVGKQDHVTARLAKRAVKHQHFANGMASYEGIAAAISADGNDVLLYPEIGMEPLICALAASRLAPIQVAGWGHPVTTGLSNVDYFISADAVEPPCAQTHYCERLVCLPGMGTRFPLPDAVPAISRQALAVNDAQPILLCAQSMFKWSPPFIAAIGQILRNNPEAVLVYFAPYRATPPSVFAALLASQWSPLGIDLAKQTRVLDEMPRQNFLAHLAACDVALDTFGFSGGQTSIDTIAVNVPIVTLEGEYMRGRQTSAMLRCINVTDTIATNSAHYIQIAQRLIDDIDVRREISQRIASEKIKLFTDTRPDQALVNWLASLP